MYTLSMPILLIIHILIGFNAYTHTHTHTLAHSQTLSLSPSHPNTQSLSIYHTIFPEYTRLYVYIVALYIVDYYTHFSRLCFVNKM